MPFNTTQYIVIGHSSEGDSYYGPYSSIEEANENLRLAIVAGCDCEAHYVRPLIQTYVGKVAI